MEDKGQMEIKKENNMYSFIAGCVGGVLQVIVGQPFDMVKIRMQNSKKAIGAGEVVKGIVGKEGYGAFYKGTMAPMAGIGMCVAIQFGTNDAMKKILASMNNNNPNFKGRNAHDLSLA